MQLFVCAFSHNLVLEAIKRGHDRRVLGLSDDSSSLDEHPFVLHVDVVPQKFGIRAPSGDQRRGACQAGGSVGLPRRVVGVYERPSFKVFGLERLDGREQLLRAPQLWEEQLLFLAVMALSDEQTEKEVEVGKDAGVDCHAAFERTQSAVLEVQYDRNRIVLVHENAAARFLTRHLFLPPPSICRLDAHVRHRFEAPRGQCSPWTLAAVNHRPTSCLTFDDLSVDPARVAGGDFGHTAERCADRRPRHTAARAQGRPSAIIPQPAVVFSPGGLHPSEHPCQPAHVSLATGWQEAFSAKTGVQLRQEGRVLSSWKAECRAVAPRCDTGHRRRPRVGIVWMQIGALGHRIEQVVGPVPNRGRGVFVLLAVFVVVACLIDQLIFRQERFMAARSSRHSRSVDSKPRQTSTWLSSSRFFERGERALDKWNELTSGGREWESFYRRRWQHDKIVRSTHGVNCTGSCSWKIYVKDGIITWETQQTDYPSNGPDVPEYEPRGCPRGASFSWYTYSPLRVKYPYVRGTLIGLYREALAEAGDPVAAWASIVEDPAKARAYKSQRGKGGFVRADWAEVAELVAAAHVYTIKRYGPDRVAGFSPIPAMSMVSYAAGTRFYSLIGGLVMSFYDWYADLPPASPQMWGDQTDVPESADWWNCSYLMLWGSNVPITRTPDAHFMTEARYKGQKVIVVSPDYAAHVKFADHWLAAHPGTDGALAMAMGHVILKEFFVDRETPYFNRYVRKYTDLPCLVILRRRGEAWVADRFLRASDLGETGENAEWKTVVWDEPRNVPAVPNGSIGFRWGDDGKGKWNLELGNVDPVLTFYGRHSELVALDLPRFDQGRTEGGEVHRRGIPARRVGEHLVATVYDLLLAQYGIGRPGLPGDWPRGYDDPEPYTPAWQEEITGVDAGLVSRIAREFARNAERTNGRSMIIMGAGTNHWYHSDQIYRAMLSLVALCGCQGVNGGGWAHYVGQEKVRPVTGWAQVAFAADWCRPTRHQATTPFWYLATDQWRYEHFDAAELASPLGRGTFEGMHFADCNAQAARLGWLPSYPTFNRNPLDLADAAEKAGMSAQAYVVSELQSGSLRFAAEDPDAPENFPRILTLWRGNLLGSSSKGHEYFLKHLLGVENAAIRGEEQPPESRPRDVVWREAAPEGKLDLLTTLDFRMTGSCLYSDVVLPAATWYEKHDISSTDMHPFIHSFNPAISPPWETRTDWDIFNTIAGAFSRLARHPLGVRKDLIAAPLLHDSPDELAQPLGHVPDWKLEGVAPVPGKTMPRLVVVERDYGAVAEKMNAIGPLVDQLGCGAKGITWNVAPEIEYLRLRNGTIANGAGAGRPALERAEHVCEAILALSGTSNGRIAVAGFTALEARTGTRLTDLAEDRGHEQLSFADVQIQPRKAITSPEWSGIERADRRYSPFTVNVERSVPWRTLTGRQQFYVDHEWMLEYGEGLPVYRPPLNLARHLGPLGTGDAGRAEVTVRYLTPHSKWSIHSEYQDNLHMLTLFRGGPVIWISPVDASVIGVVDNDWIEAFNLNGVVSCRAVVSHRIPMGTSIMYHAQDRHVNVPRTELTGTRGGTDNSLTKIYMKPTHMIGGYAQLAYGFNYYGPTGTQRDEITILRKRVQEVIY